MAQETRVLSRPNYPVGTRIRGVLGLGAALSGSLVLSIYQAIPVSAAPGWLDRLNAWRVATNVAPLTENTTWDQGDYNHSLYMVKNDQVTHYEVSTLPYYTLAGDTAARNGNIQVSGSTSTSDQAAIDWWMVAPFHELGMMDPRLTSTGFGSYREVKSGWQAGFTLDTLRGNPFTGGTYPVYFPGAGSSVPLTSYGGGEFPDPLQACSGYTAPTGLPITIQVGGNVATSVTAHALTANGSPVAHCAIDSSNPAVGSSLTYRGAVIVVPRSPLQGGVTYTVALTVNAVPYTWSFSISTDGSIVPPIPTGWSSIGGVATSAPAITSSAGGRLDAFVRGSDNALWHRAWNGTAWGAWESLGGTLTIDPGAVAQGTNVDVFVRGTDRAIWHRSSNGTAWSPWDTLGGIATSAIAAASWAPGHIDIVVRGTDNALWHRAQNSGVWGPWDSLGGVASSNPAAVSSAANRLDVFVRGTDNSLWQRAYGGTAWGGWTALGGILTSGPAASSCAAGHVDVFVLGTDSGLHQRGFNGTSWGSWSSMPGLWAMGPAAVCPAGTTTVQLLEVAYSYAVVQATAPGS